MNKLWLSEKMIAKSFWEALHSSVLVKQAQRDSEEICSLTSPLVDKFPSIAGSISERSCVTLWLLAKYFSPKFIMEIGTYIGRSSLSMSFGGKDTIEKFYTCDGTFDCLDFSSLKALLKNEENTPCIDKIRYFGKTMSHSLLETVRSENDLKVDMLFVDGRLSAQDCDLLPLVLSPESVIVVDDFDGGR